MNTDQKATLSPLEQSALRAKNREERLKILRSAETAPDQSTRKKFVLDLYHRSCEDLIKQAW